MCGLLGLSPSGKENPTNGTQNRCLLGNRAEATDTSLLVLYYNLPVGKLDHAELKAGKPTSVPNSPDLPISPGPSYHRFSLAGQEPPSWSVISSTALLQPFPAQ